MLIIRIEIDSTLLLFVLLLVCFDCGCCLLLGLSSSWAMHLLHSLFNLSHLSFEIEDTFLLFFGATHWVLSHSAVDKVLADELQDFALRSILIIAKVSVHIKQLEFNTSQMEVVIGPLLVL